MCHLVGQFDAPTKKGNFFNFLQRREMGHQTTSTWGVGSQIETELQLVIYGCMQCFITSFNKGIIGVPIDPLYFTIHCIVHILFFIFNSVHADISFKILHNTDIHI